ncbi:MAG: 50S ribosomal protein L39e [Candidatus Micrarchaeia archaeon]|jgi:large subunit ribosomal protein L39e
MSKNRSKEKKAVLTKKLTQNRRMPIFVIARTARKVSRNSKTRNWRSQKMKLKVQ